MNLLLFTRHAGDMYRTYREIGGSDKNAVIIVTKHLKESGTCRSYQFFKCPGVYFLDMAFSIFKF